MDERTVDQLGEQLSDIFRQSREQTGMLVRLGERIDAIHRLIVEGGPPLLPRQDDRGAAR